MAKKYVTLVAIGLAARTILAGQEIELTDEQALPLLKNGSILEGVGKAPKKTDDPNIGDQLAKELLTMSDDEFEQRIASMNAAARKEVAVALEIDISSAKNKDDVADLIRAVHRAANGDAS